MDSNSKWFQTLEQVDRWFQRKDATHVIVAFTGYKCENYFLGCEALTKAGAFQLTCDYDKQCGKTFAIFREPGAAIQDRVS